MQLSLKQWKWNSWVSGLCLLGMLGAGTSKYFFHADSSIASKIEAPLSFASMSSLQYPLYFEENVGQVDPQVKFLSRGQGYTFCFTPQEVVMVLKNAREQENLPTSTLTIQFAGGAQNPQITGINLQEYKTHYYRGNDPAQWHTDVPNFAKVSYTGLYPGIDAVFYGNQSTFEYDITVAPGANPQHPCLHIEGAQQLSIDGSGNLCMHIDATQHVQMQKPVVYQEIHGEKVFVEGDFLLLAQNDVGFSVGPYDPTYPLVIDPVVLYSSFLGGSDEDIGSAIATDSAGNAYITGLTSSINFPTQNPLQATYGGGFRDAFITKVDSTGSALIYSTYLGGSGADVGKGIAVDGSNNAYVAGETDSINFPVTGGAFQTALPGFDSAFVAKISATGTLSYSTYLGGSLSGSGNGIAVDSGGNAYVVGDTTSLDFPLVNPIQGSLAGDRDVFITKMNPTGSALVYSTYLGGSAFDNGMGITLDSNGDAYITGTTQSLDFPTTVGAFQTAGNGIDDAFVAKIASAGPTLAYSTYLGGSSAAFGNAIAVDSDGNAYVVGITDPADFPTTPGAYQTTFVGVSSTAFVTKLNATGSNLIYSTYLSSAVNGNNITVNASGNAYITGDTSNLLFPLVNPLQTSGRAILTQFNAAGSDLLFSTYIGGTRGSGIALDASENIYITGDTNGILLTPTPGVFQPTFGGAIDAFVTKISQRDVFPPNNLRGQQIANKFLMQTEFVNVLTWTAPTVGHPPLLYRIYRNASLTELAGVVSACGQVCGRLEFVDHGRKPCKIYSYWVVSVDASGNVSTPATVTVQPLKK